MHGEVEGAYRARRRDGTEPLHGGRQGLPRPDVRRFVPYGGIGAGVYHENTAGRRRRGHDRAVFVGLKLKFPMGLVLRGEYQWLDMPDAAPVKLDNRYFFGVGLSF